MWWIAFVVIVPLLIVVLVLFLTRHKRGDSGEPSKRERHHFHGGQKERFGRKGEEAVSALLTSVIKEHDGFLLNDFAFKDEQGYTSEIDHILICTAGVFVVETKSNKGVVSGQKEGDFWHVRKQEWQVDRNPKNPLKQNQGHINHLRRLWGKGAPKMISMVVYPFANITLVSDLVYDLSGARKFIESKFVEPRYSIETSSRLHKELLSLQSKYGISHEEHMRRIKEIHKA